MTATPTTISEFAPDRASFYEGDPEAAFAALRSQEPVHWYEPGQFWCVTRQAEIREISRSPRRFSSASGTQMFQIPLVLAGETLLPAGPEGEVSILEMDPPEHAHHRRLVMSAFTPRYIRQLEERVRQITRETLDRLDPAEEIDFVEQIAVPVPMRVIAEMIGIQGGDTTTFRRWSDSIVEAGSGGFTDATLVDLAELFEYLSASLEQHRVEPAEDIITLLQQADTEGEKLTEGAILVFLMTLLVAGNETTRNLIAGSGAALAAHPDQRAWLADDHTRIPNAVDELLRWTSPVRSFIRRATEDTTLAGQAIGAGDFVVMFYGSGNRDEDVFGDDADQLDLARENANRHISFGFGEHVCLGAALAKIEGRIVLEELLARWPEWEVVGDPQRFTSVLMNGLVRLPVRLQP